VRNNTAFAQRGKVSQALGIYAAKADSQGL